MSLVGTDIETECIYENTNLSIVGKDMSISSDNDKHMKTGMLAFVCVVSALVWLRFKE